MKPKRLTILLLVFSILLGACTTASTTTTLANPGAASGGGQLSQSMQLALGILKLEQTPYAVDAAQAAQLLPLWKAARSIGSSGSAAPEEVAGLQKQILNNLSAEQRQAIQDMNLSMQDIQSIAQELGIQMGMGAGGNMDATLRATAQAARQSGQAPPSGMMLGNPGGSPGGEMGGFSPGMQRTAQAGRTASGASFGVPPALLEAMIKFLQDKVQ